MQITRIALLVGRGSRAPAVLRCVQSMENGEVVLAMSYWGEGVGFLAARTEYGIPTEVILWKDYKKREGGREQFAATAIEVLQNYDVQFIVMAGWHVLMPPSFVERFRGRIINIHPSILPKYPGDGDKAIEAQWLNKEVPSGCTLHYVDEGMDTGKIILQAFVNPHEYQTIEEFTEAIHEQEDLVLCEGIKKLVDERIFPKK